MLTALVSVFLLAIVTLFIHKKGSILTPVILAAFTAGLFVYLLTFLPVISRGETAFFSYSWADSLGIKISFYLDGLSLFFALLISFFGVLILLYAAWYMKGYDQTNRFFSILLFFMGSMLGLVLSANLICLFIFWELTSFTSYLLIGFSHKDKKSRQAAHQAWLITATGGLALLAAFILLEIAGGSYTLTALLSQTEIIRDSPYLTAIIILLLGGAFTKSAQFPFHFWLPNAMAAPTPVSAYLHSATMVKAGVYLVFRMNGIFADVTCWQLLLTIFGGFTMLMGSIVAFRADDLKRILAYSTISALGIFFLMIGIGSKEAGQAAIVYVMAHALYKATLFLVTGILDQQCKTRKVSELATIPKKMPYTKTAAIMATLSMGGIIPFTGFTGKELLYQAALHHELLQYASITALMLSSILFVAICFKLIIPVFFHPKIRNSGQKYVPEASAFMYAPPLMLGILGLAIGLYPGIGITSILETAAGSIINATEPLDLALWHGFNIVFILSLITLLLGAGLYFISAHYNRWYDHVPISVASLPEVIYEKSLNGLVNFAGFQTKMLQSGYLRHYISMYVVTLGLLVLYYLLTSSGFRADLFELRLESLQIYEVAVLMLVLFTISFTFISRSRLAILASIGVTGYGIALAYVLFSAPDVAITQFLVETLGLILLAIILPNLPGLRETALYTKRKYLFISAAFGLLMAYITLITMSYESDSKLKQFFLENSIPLGKGENAVNVILVDFRALDTLGEISVLVITMVGIISFLAKKKRKTDL